MRWFHRVVGLGLLASCALACAARDDRSGAVVASAAGGAQASATATRPGGPGRFVQGPALRGGRFFHADVLLPSGEVYSSGGLLGAALPWPRSDAERIDPRSGASRDAAALTGGYFQHRVVLQGGLVLLLGGNIGGRILRYDPAVDAIADLGALNESRANHSATALADGTILVAGGMGLSLSGARLNTAPALSLERIQPAFGASRRLATRMAAPRIGHSANLLVDGRVLIVGGNGQRETLYFDPVGEFLAAGPALNLAREEHRATPLADGRILVSGGSDAAGVSLDSLEVYEPAVARFRLLTARLSEGREDHSASLLTDGRVLIAGGEANQAGPGGADIVLQTADIFDPRSDILTSAGKLLRARDDHQATLLSDGRVLITGGEDDQGAAIADSEYWTP